MWCDHFIGDGYWYKINDLVDKILIYLAKVNVYDINDRMLDVYDEIPLSKISYTVTCIAYGDWDKYDYPSTYKYNNLISVQDTSKRKYIISHIRHFGLEHTQKLN